MNRILATSLLLNVALVVAIVLFGSFTGFFVRSNVLDPLYERQVTVFEAFGIERGDLAFVGDTIIAEAPLHEMFPDLPVRNRGIIGDTSQGVLDRLEQVVMGEPAAVVLMIGTFDVLEGVSRRETVARVGAILDRLGEARPDLRVLLLSVLPRDVEAERSVARLNADYEALAAARGIDYLDLASAYRGADGAIDARYSNDELHLNGPGYVRLRDGVRPWLRDVGDAGDGAGVASGDGVAGAPDAEPGP